MSDFGQQRRYRKANARLGSVQPGERRVVFFGDSITDFWQLDRFFPARGYINRGISGQTTAQMVARFREDVLSLSPQVVVILAGTNDIAGNTGPMTPQQTQANYAAMGNLAKEQGVQVVFSSVMPVHAYTSSAFGMLHSRPPEKILELNAWLKEYCEQNGLIYLDYYAAMVDKRGFLRRELAEDGLHPNAAGYQVMTSLAQAALEQALMRPASV